MTTSSENSAPVAFRDLDADARLRELASLQEELRRPELLTHRRLSDWASVSRDRSALLSGSVWGGIHWSRGLGRPLAPSITTGFSITHEYKKLNFVDHGGGNIVDESAYVIQSAPSVWDATSNANEYRVGFFFFAGGGGINPNRLTVKLAPVPWEKVSFLRPGYRRLNPIGYSPFGNLGKLHVIPDFEVEHVAFPIGRYVESLGPSWTLASQDQVAGLDIRP